MLDDDYDIIMNAPADRELVALFFKTLVEIKDEPCARCGVALFKHVQLPRDHKFILSPEDVGFDETN
jgi:hypothetical protein